MTPNLDLASPVVQQGASRKTDDSAMNNDPALAASLWPLAPTRHRRRDKAALVRSESSPGNLSEKADSVRARRPGLAARTDLTFGSWAAKKRPTTVVRAAPVASPSSPSGRTPPSSPPRLQIPSSHRCSEEDPKLVGSTPSLVTPKGILKKLESPSEQSVDETQKATSQAKAGATSSIQFLSFSDIHPSGVRFDEKLPATPPSMLGSSPALFKFRAASLRSEGSAEGDGTPTNAVAPPPGSYEAVWSAKRSQVGSCACDYIISQQIKLINYANDSAARFRSFCPC